MTDAKKALDDHIAAKRHLQQVGRADHLTGVVTVNWLATVFRMNRAAVIKRLSACPTVKAPPGGDYRTERYYDLATAARYLVPPAMPTEDFVKLLNRNELPSALQVAFWDALLKRQKWETEAGQLWPTHRVMEALSEVFQTLKFTMQLWVDTLEREVAVSREQRAILIRLVDGLQEQIYDILVERAQNGTLGSLQSDLPTLLGSEDGQPPVVEEDDDLYSVI